MTRLSRDEVRSGRVWNGFDYRLQVWVIDGNVQPCAHPERMRRDGPCCLQAQYAGQSILDLPGAEARCDAPAPEGPDALARISARGGSLIEGELHDLPDGCPVVITLGSGHRATTTAAQAPRFLELLGEAVAAVVIPAAALARLYPGSATGRDPDPPASAANRSV